VSHLLGYSSAVRWVPQEPTCQECGFDWGVGAGEAVESVRGLASKLASRRDQISRSSRTTPEGWSARGYLWHLVDVFSIGTERLLTLHLDPANGIPCWDENALAAARRYEKLSVPVGLVALSGAVDRWMTAAHTVPLTATIEHPLFGTLGAEDVIRRNAHEGMHHELDIRRLIG
jgi:hypothetical protein